MNSENPRVLRTNWFHWTKSVDKVLEIFQTYGFRKSNLKEYTFLRKKATEHGIGSKEYTLSAIFRKTKGILIGIKTKSVAKLTHLD